MLRDKWLLWLLSRHPEPPRPVLQVSFSVSAAFVNMSKKAGTRSNEADMSLEVSIIRIPPHHYIHVLDQNTNIARIEVGPLTYIRQDNER